MTSPPICPTHKRPMRWYAPHKVWSCTAKIGQTQDGKSLFCDYKTQGGSPSPRAAAPPGPRYQAESGPVERAAALQAAAEVFSGTMNAEDTIAAANLFLSFLRGEA